MMWGELVRRLSDPDTAGVLAAAAERVDDHAEARWWHRRALGARSRAHVVAARLALGAWAEEHGTEDPVEHYRAVAEVPRARWRLGVLAEAEDVVAAREHYEAAACGFDPEVAVEAALALADLEHRQGDRATARQWYAWVVTAPVPLSVGDAAVVLDLADRARAALADLDEPMRIARAEQELNRPAVVVPAPRGPADPADPGGLRATSLRRAETV